MVFEDGATGFLLKFARLYVAGPQNFLSQQFWVSGPPLALPVSDRHVNASVSYCPFLHQLVQSFADLGEVGPEGAAGVVQLGQELGVGVMVENVVDPAVGFGSEVGVDQLQQQIPAAGQELLHHSLVKGEVHLHQ